MNGIGQKPVDRDGNLAEIRLIRYPSNEHQKYATTELKESLNGAKWKMWI